ncbi:hypothetical protein [Bradyrhizobium sp. SYSU BS000235]|uniref:hypothetical protein n=1 Tax=Bradyrhizobium sp. SYSU BS000235 TaxID=3411332 RepID=UPI003C769173
MAKARTRAPKPEATSTDILELAPTVPHQVAETKRLIRLVPIGNDLTSSYRQIALVAAETEAEARQLAASYDPFGRDWKNVELFSAESFDDTNAHVIGDVIFKSTPLPKTKTK